MVKINVFIKRKGNRKFELYKTIEIANAADAGRIGTEGIGQAWLALGGGAVVKDAYWNFAK